MRKLLVCLLAMVAALPGLSQPKDSTSRRFKRFKVDISVGYAGNN